jgi:hypothetical protein
MVMTESEFNSIADKLEPPKDSEDAIKLDCTDYSVEAIMKLLENNGLLA